MSRFTNKIVVITAGTSGIGLATAGQLTKEGAKVVVIGRSPQSVRDAQKELGANGIAIAADVTKSAELDSVFQQLREKYGRIEVLYANAGIVKLGSVAETTEEVFDDILDANFRGAYFTVQKALPLLSDGAAIVFTTSWFAGGSRHSGGIPRLRRRLLHHRRRACCRRRLQPAVTGVIGVERQQTPLARLAAIDSTTGAD